MAKQLAIAYASQARGVAHHPLSLTGEESRCHSPSTALAMMFRWISLEPPKIEVLRMLK